MAQPNPGSAGKTPDDLASAYGMMLELMDPPDRVGLAREQSASNTALLEQMNQIIEQGSKPKRSFIDKLEPAALSIAQLIDLSSGNSGRRGRARGVYNFYESARKEALGTKDKKQRQTMLDQLGVVEKTLGVQGGNYEALTSAVESQQGTKRASLTAAGYAENRRQRKTEGDRPYDDKAAAKANYEQAVAPYMNAETGEVDWERASKDNRVMTAAAEFGISLPDVAGARNKIFTGVKDRVFKLYEDKLLMAIEEGPEAVEAVLGEMQAMEMQLLVMEGGASPDGQDAYDQAFGRGEGVTPDDFGNPPAGPSWDEAAGQGVMLKLEDMLDKTGLPDAFKGIGRAFGFGE